MAAAVAVAAEWQLLDNRYYRKPELYSMCWQKMDLRRHRVACARFGGPIAAIRDDSKIIQLFAESARRKLLIFNSAGILLASAIWDRPGGRLVGMGWTDEETLVCVVQDGSVYRYDVHAHPVEPQLSLGIEAADENVVECVFWGNGIVCVTDAGRVFCIPDLKSPQACRLCEAGLVPGELPFAPR